MKNFLMLSLLLLFVGCGKNSSSSPIKNKSVASANGPTIPYIIDSNTSTEDIDEGTGGTTSGNPIGSNEDPGPADEASSIKNYLCDFSNDNAFAQVKIKVQESKTATLILEDSVEKFTFDGFTLSPSGNENASVHHENPDQLVAEGKVIKITARIIMNEEINEGELQVSYRVKVGKLMIVTDFTKLALINNCLLQ
jgi:hypothetical protein